MGGRQHTPAALTPGKESPCPLYRRLGGPQGRSGRVRKISHPPGFDLRTVQPVTSRYTDYAIPTHGTYFYHCKFHVTIFRFKSYLTFHMFCLSAVQKVLIHASLNAGKAQLQCFFPYFYLALPWEKMFMERTEKRVLDSQLNASINAVLLDYLCKITYVWPICKTYVRLRVRTPVEIRDFLSFSSSNSAMGPTQLPVQCVSALFPGEKLPQRDVDHSPPSSAEVQHCTAILLLRLCAFTACCRVNLDTSGSNPTTQHEISGHSLLSLYVRGLRLDVRLVSLCFSTL